MNIAVTKIKDVHGRRVLGYRASFAGVSARGETPAAAKANLESLLPQVIKHLRQAATVLSLGGGYMVTFQPSYHDAFDYEQFLAHPDGHVVQSSLPADHFDRDVYWSRINVAQLRHAAGDPKAEDSLVTDEQRAEFRGWVETQRRYRVLMDAGYPEYQAWSIAMGNPLEPLTFERAMENPPAQVRLAGVF